MISKLMITFSPVQQANESFMGHADITQDGVRSRQTLINANQPGLSSNRMMLTTPDTTDANRKFKTSQGQGSILLMEAGCADDKDLLMN